LRSIKGRLISNKSYILCWSENRLKINLSVPDDFYARMEKVKDLVNLSEIFREAVSKEMEKLQQPGLIIEELKLYLERNIVGGGDRVDNAAKREQELDRFTYQWGEPLETERRESTVPPWMNITKAIPLEIGNERITTLKIINWLAIAGSIHEGNFGGQMTEFDPERWKGTGNGKLAPTVEFFKSKGFKVVEHIGPTRKLFAALETNDILGEADCIMGSEGVTVLLATDGRDLVYIAYRKN
jgi:hypothetical protein